MAVAGSFNIRVYGIHLNKNLLLLTDERRNGFEFTKLPGGGMEFGETTVDCLKREFKEEYDCEITVQNHFYTTDIFVPSIWNPKQQIISIYYLIKSDAFDEIPLSNERLKFHTDKEDELHWRWANLELLTEHDFTFPIDKVVLKKLVNKK